MSAPTHTVYATPGTQGQVIPVQQGHVIVRPASSSRTEMSGTQKGCFVGLGSTQLVIGILCMVFNIVAMVFQSALTLYVAPGLWCGILFIITGSFGIAGGKQTSRAKEVTFMVLSIISACAAVVLFSVAIISALIGADDYYYDELSGAAIGMDCVLTVLGFLEIVIAITSSAVGCSAICCRQQQYNGAILNVNAGGYTYGTTAGMVVTQPPFNHQVTYPAQQWPSGQGHPAVESGVYQAQGPPAYQHEATKNDLASGHAAPLEHPPMHDAPAYNSLNDFQC